jgi:hypothetical protein
MDAEGLEVLEESEPVLGGTEAISFEVGVLLGRHAKKPKSAKLSD